MTPLQRTHAYVAIVAHVLTILAISIMLYLGWSIAGALHDRLDPAPISTTEPYTGCDASYADCPTG